MLLGTPAVLGAGDRSDVGEPITARLAALWADRRTPTSWPAIDRALVLLGRSRAGQQHAGRSDRRLDVAPARTRRSPPASPSSRAAPRRRRPLGHQLLVECEELRRGAAVANAGCRAGTAARVSGTGSTRGGSRGWRLARGGVVAARPGRTDVVDDLLSEAGVRLTRQARTHSLGWRPVRSSPACRRTCRCSPSPVRRVRRPPSEELASAHCATAGWPARRLGDRWFGTGVELASAATGRSRARPAGRRPTAASSSRRQRGTTSSAVVADRTAATGVLAVEPAGDQLGGDRRPLGDPHQHDDRAADLGQRPPVDVGLAGRRWPVTTVNARPPRRGG